MLFRLYKNRLGLVIKGDIFLSSCRYSSSDSLVVKKVGIVTCIGLNRPEFKNRLTTTLMKDVKEAIDCFEKDEGSPVAVLYGERGNFSYGYDLDELNENPAYFKELEKIGLLDMFTSKPIVAAISGFAVGLAFDVSLWCDFRVVEDTAVMGGYARKFGYPISDTVAKRLCSMVGTNKALDLILTGRILKPQEALNIDIASRIVSCGTGLGQAVSFANSLANMPQACLKADRATILSISEKYSNTCIKDVILSVKEKERNLALEEAESGLHVTRSEDVRRKE